MKLTMKSFSLIEILIAVLIASIVIIALFSLAFQNLTTSELIRHRLIAAHLAQEGIEIVSNIRSTNFLKYGNIVNPKLNPDGTLEKWRGEIGCGAGSADCLVDGVTYIAQYNSALLAVDATNPPLLVDANSFYCYSGCSAPTSPSPYHRQIQISTINSHQMKVEVIVSWQYNGQPYSLSVEDRLYNYL